MGTFHIAPTAHFYNYLQLESQDVTNNPSIQGIVCYHTSGNSGSTRAGGALYVSVPDVSANTGYTYRALVDKLEAGDGINILRDSVDPGKWTISADSSSGGGTGEIQVKTVTVPKGSANVTPDGICYAYIGNNLVNGFVYRAYDQNGDTVAVSVYKSSTNDRYVTINFGTSDAFTRLNSAVYIDIIVGTAKSAVSSTTTSPID